MRIRTISLGVAGALAVAGGAWLASLDKPARDPILAMPTDRDVLSWSRSQRRAAFQDGKIGSLDDKVDRYIPDLRGSA